VHGSDDRRYKDLQIVDAFVLAGMFALSARFSSSPWFVDTAPKERGAPFAAQAKSIYIDFIMRPNRLARPSLSLLQGCILLAFYEETCGPSLESWLSVGVCTRLASELGLDKIDEDLIGVDYSSQWKSSHEWVEREEKRRSWWLVWELDVFASTILNRPHAIDKSQIHVLLPVSDEQWFNNCPISSTFIIPHVTNTWKTLQDCPNQDVRAWFLVCTFFMATAHDMSRKHNISEQDLIDFESSRVCFSLLLPVTFSLSSSSLTFTETNFSTSNWVVSTIFMLNT
jgi:Fungal specific transcription factor domain